MKNIIQSLKVVALGLMLAIGLSYAFAWTAPTGNPPTGNVSAPINVGDADQIKIGIMSFLTSIDVPLGYFGQVAIGTVTPSNKLTIDLGSANNNEGILAISSGTESALQLRNTATGGKEWQILSTGGDAGAGQGKLQFYNKTDSITGMQLDEFGNLNSPGVICDSTGCIGGGGGSGGGSGGIPSGYVEEYFNAVEDTYVSGGGGSSDTCNGDKAVPYGCGVSEEGGCVDKYNPICDTTYGYSCSYSSRIVTCKQATVLVKYNNVSECSDTGKIHTIPDNSINDGGGTSAGDALEVYCFDGVARWCLSGEACPWKGASSDTTGGKTCSRAGLGSDWMAKAYDNYWIDNFGKLYTNYYCNLSEQKYGN